MSIEHRKPCEPMPEESEKSMTTLLDKALSYREQHSECWQAREKDREITFMETFGVYQEDPFLKAYYKKQDAKVQKKKKEHAKRKLEVGKFEYLQKI